MGYQSRPLENTEILKYLDLLICTPVYIFSAFVLCISTQTGPRIYRSKSCFYALTYHNDLNENSDKCPTFYRLTLYYIRRNMYEDNHTAFLFSQHLCNCFAIPLLQTLLTHLQN